MDPLAIRKKRNAHQLSVAECARIVCVSDRTWRRWEDGTRKMPEGALELFVLKQENKNNEDV